MKISMLSSALASHNWHQLSRRTGRSPVNALHTERLSQKKCRGSLYVDACVDVRIYACVNAEKVHVSDHCPCCAWMWVHGTIRISGVIAGFTVGACIG